MVAWRRVARSVPVAIAGVSHDFPTSLPGVSLSSASLGYLYLAPTDRQSTGHWPGQLTTSWPCDWLHGWLQANQRQLSSSSAVTWRYVQTRNRPAIKVSANSPRPTLLLPFTPYYSLPSASPFVSLPGSAYVESISRFLQVSTDDFVIMAS